MVAANVATMYFADHGVYGRTEGQSFIFVIAVVIAYIMLRRWWKKR